VHGERDAASAVAAGGEQGREPEGRTGGGLAAGQRHELAAASADVGPSPGGPGGDAVLHEVRNPAGAATCAKRGGAGRPPDAGRGGRLGAEFPFRRPAPALRILGRRPALVSAPAAVAESQRLSVFVNSV